MDLTYTVIVVSDTIYHGLKKDESGEKAIELIEKQGYRVISKKIIPNDPKQVINALREAKDSDVIVLIGGTGPSPRDITIDVIESLAWRKIPGFGEVFRYESYREIGGRGLISRSELFLLYDGKPVLVLPGSTSAVELGLKIFFELVEHLVEEARRITGRHGKHHINQ